MCHLNIGVTRAHMPSQVNIYANFCFNPVTLLPGPPGPESAWEARLENIKQHASNLTHVSPCIYALEPDGSFGVQNGHAQGNYSDIAPHIPALQAMGLGIIPIIYNVGGTSGICCFFGGVLYGAVLRFSLV